ncbi:GreA/GreB family elongation factor [Conchiformibius kuhniae]|uniref:GreA/GreB family elongation factor n=1 Tax=Conchiformibius kuhniae TaxID=211502 RepID=A0A8T9MV74_9NEIS|nr:GreA/GreB family elongation factor [Conchiformibius kuhniae]UOP05014.1 GreA/GreB family elongation factor [Conchiformibius kuhniae]
MIYLTENGFKRLQSLLQKKQEEYDQVRAARQAAFELSGDGWHDNPEFNRQQQMEASLNHTIKELTDRLAQARLVVITEGARPVGEVAIGSWVSISRWNVRGNERIDEQWEIVGFDETDADCRQIAYNAPLAKAIMGLKTGDLSEELSLGNQTWEIEITALSKNKPSIHSN